MMPRNLLILCALVWGAGPVAAVPQTFDAKLPPEPEPTVHPLVSRIAFGSCQTQDEPRPILRTVLEWEPELFIYLGDNIYGDTNDMAVLEAKYAKLGAKKEFKALRASVPTIATWDDHDYGANDAGKDYPLRKESKDIFLKFWNEPNPSLRRDHDGIYTSYRFEDKSVGKTLQIILLDTRTFRDLPLELPLTSWKNDYVPDPDPTKTILGEFQWKWLEERLQEPADLRIIGSSIQFSHEYNGWESWTNFPRELLKMVDLIKSTKANGVVFISGDVHCPCCVRRIAIRSMISRRADSIATGRMSNLTAIAWASPARIFTLECSISTGPETRPSPSVSTT